MDDAFQRRRDLLLAKRLLAGDQKAFEEFGEANFGPLFRFALARVGGNEEEAAELVQNTLVTALRRLDSYRGDGALLTWLCGICRFEVSSFLRSRRRRPVEVSWEEDGQAGPETLEEADFEAADSALERKERQARVHQALDELPSHYGQVLEWKYLEDLSMAEIADRLSLTVKAVESLLTRARKAFRDRCADLEGGGEGGPGGAPAGRNPRP